MLVKQEKVFSPITIVIDCEEDLQDLKLIAHHNRSIPSLIKQIVMGGDYGEDNDELEIYDHFTEARLGKFLVELDKALKTI